MTVTLQVLLGVLSGAFCCAELIFEYTYDAVLKDDASTREKLELLEKAQEINAKNKKQNRSATDKFIRLFLIVTFIVMSLAFLIQLSNSVTYEKFKYFVNNEIIVFDISFIVSIIALPIVLKIIARIKTTDRKVSSLFTNQAKGLIERKISNYKAE